MHLVKHILFLMELVFAVGWFAMIHYFTVNLHDIPSPMKMYNNALIKTAIEYYVQIEIDLAIWIFLILNKYIVGVRCTDDEIRGDSLSIILMTILSAHVMINLTICVIKMGFLIPPGITLFNFLHVFKFWIVGSILFIYPLKQQLNKIK